MQNVIYKLKDKIAESQSQDMTVEQERYVAGLKDALDLIENSVADNLVVGNTYFVIMYRNGDKYLPYIEEMRLYKVSNKSIKCSYCFTRELNITKHRTGTPDLVLASKKGLAERVFFTKEQADKAIEE